MHKTFTPVEIDEATAKRIASYKTLTVVDIDETVFRTHAKILVLKGGCEVRQLNNQEFNDYVNKGRLQEGESFDFKQFRDADLFYKTSEPIPKTISWLQKAIDNIETYKSENDHGILFLTARPIPTSHNTILKTFIEHGVDVRSEDIHFAYTSDMPKEEFPTGADRKNAVIKWYLRDNKDISVVRMFDDNDDNLKGFKDFMSNHNEERETPIKYYALKVLQDGTLEKK